MPESLGETVGSSTCCCSLHSHHPPGMLTGHQLKCPGKLLVVHLQPEVTPLAGVNVTIILYESRHEAPSLPCRSDAFDCFVVAGQDGPAMLVSPAILQP